MANKNFVVKNGLTVGNLTVDADSGDLTTSGNLTVASINTDSYFYANGTPFSTAGALGYTGSQGAQGIQGTPGAQGTTGFAGSRGTDGTIGSDGYTGSRGIDGIIGVDGYTGSRGNTGAAGFTGSTGLSGASYAVLDIAPTAANSVLNAVRSTPTESGFTTTADIPGNTPIIVFNQGSNTRSVTGSNRVYLYGINRLMFYVYQSAAQPPEEDLLVEYSVDGTTWSNLHTVSYTGIPNDLWVQRLFEVPAAAKSAGGVYLRIVQNSADGADVDIWSFTSLVADVQGYTGSAGAAGTTGFAGSTGFVGSQGSTGLGFRIARSYSSVAALEADTAPTGIVAGEFAIIETGNVQDADNSKLYLWSGTAYSYVTDLSGAAGITGPAGTTGFTGSAGAGGSAGTAGAAGFTGSAGTAGSAGFVGSAGSTGFVGSSGSAGFVGSIGFTGSRGSGAITTANSAPTSPGAGDLWYNTGRDVLLRYMNVGTGSFWIDVSGPIYNFGVSANTTAAIALTAQGPTVDYLIVAGGGGGGGGLSGVYNSGSGGAGGLLTSSAILTGGTTYVVAIGAGGTGGTTAAGVAGSNTTLSGLGITAYGGGGGGGSGNGTNGGSGGGGGGPGGATTGGKGVYPGSTYVSAPRQGHDGGNGPGGFISGGGGGAGGAGGAGTAGIGVVSLISGASAGYAGGGDCPDAVTYGSGTGNGGAATSNSGSGGASGYASPQRPGGAGGSGIVIMRYPDTFAAAAGTTGSPTVTVAGGYRIYRFTTSGSITF